MHLYGAFGALSAWTTTPPRLFAFGPEHNQQLTSHPAKFRMMPASTVPPERAQAPAAAEALNCLRSGLLSLDGDAHRRHRRAVSAGFRQRENERHVDTVASVTARVLDTWREGGAVEAEQQLRRLVHQLAIRLVLGVENPDSADRLVLLVNRFVDTAPRAMMFPISFPSSSYSRLLATAREIVAVLEHAIAEKRADPAAEGVLAVLLRVVCQDDAALSDRELIGEAYNVLCHESTASALTWTLFLLAQHPPVAQALRQELRDVLRGGPPGAADLERLRFLDHVLKESLRLLPPAPFMRRFLAEPCAFGGFVAPANTPVFFSQYVTHRMPEIFPEPLRFLPGRWETCRPTPQEYFPFGLGPHNCVAGSFAAMEMKIVIAMIVQRYRFHVPSGTSVDRVYQLSLRPRDGLRLVVDRPDGIGTRTRVGGTINEMVDLS